MELINKIRKSRKGFTLVEIIVVLVILAILAAFTIPTMIGFVNEAKGKARIAQAREIYVAAQAAATEIVATQTATPALAADATPITGNVLGSRLSTTVAAAADGGAITQPIDKTMKDYIAGDIPTNASWIVTADGAASASKGKVTKVEYKVDGYTITVDKTNSGTGAITITQP
jgi:type IV pilus assembly protein PilA